MRGVDIQTVANVLGHKTLRMTQRYSHLSSGHLKVSIELAAPCPTPTTATKVLQSETPLIDPQFGTNKNPLISEGALAWELVDPTGIEPATSSMPWRRSPS